MIIVWHYRDLRVHDHEALTFASGHSSPILPIYIHDPQSEGLWKAGAASNWWLHHSLSSLKARYKSLKNNLIVRQGNAQLVLKQLIDDLPIEKVCWIQRDEPSLRERDSAIKNWLESLGVDVFISNLNRLTCYDELKTATGKPYVVFTPYSKGAFAQADFIKTRSIPDLKNPSTPPSDPIESLGLLPKIRWDKQFQHLWEPGREGAKKNLYSFCKNYVNHYEASRDFLSKPSTSKLSPHLTFGEISLREVWIYCNQFPHSKPFLRQLLWNEFAHYFVYHFPESTHISWKKAFENYPWQTNKQYLKKWQTGMTGYPIVDAAMRQLWQTGWMHNRARMIVASFLVKDLHIHWIEGAKWFWDTLVDADLCNNTLGWQWVAGSGPDAAPYFRIFNPILQSQKFDPDGDYIRKYIPEIRQLETKWIHAPWEARSSTLSQANIKLGINYPNPIVDHKKARAVALAGYEKIKTSKKA